MMKCFKNSFTNNKSCCLNQAQHVFPLWHEFCFVTFWLLGWVFSILNLLNEGCVGIRFCTWKLFSLFDSLTNCFLGFGVPLLFLSPPASLPLLSAMNNYQQHLSLLKMNMKAKFWHSLYHEIKSAANPVFQKLVCVRRCNSIAASWLELTMHREEQGLRSPASRAGRTLFYWMPLRCFVICWCT